jgi:hypothetical protein
MVTIYRKPSTTHEGPGYELRLGRPSWNPQSNEEWSAKFAYLNANGRVARSSPETPVSVLPELIVFAAERGVFSKSEVEDLITTLRSLYPESGRAQQTYE